MGNNKGKPWLLLAQILLQILSSHGEVPAIIVFGDSTVDAGNNNQIPTILKSNFPPYGRDFKGSQSTGRFSNGRIATDFISEAFGIKPTIPAYLDPTYDITEFASGVCFASAGTGYDNATSDVLSVVPLWKEMEYYKEYQQRLRGYLGEVKADMILREALYLISLGTNDFLENYYILRRRQTHFSEKGYQEFLLSIAKSFITELHRLGARKITISGLPPMGCLPLERTTNILEGGACVERYNIVARNFNEKMKELVMELNKELDGIQLVNSDVYDILWIIIQNPYAFGFEDAAKACCGTGRYEMSYLCDKHNPLTCKDASKYVFWDSFHPSEKTNSIVADYVVKNNLNIFL